MARLEGHEPRLVASQDERAARYNRAVDKCVGGPAACLARRAANGQASLDVYVMGPGGGVGMHASDVAVAAASV